MCLLWSSSVQFFGPVVVSPPPFFNNKYTSNAVATQAASVTLRVPSHPDSQANEILHSNTESSEEKDIAQY